MTHFIFRIKWLQFSIILLGTVVALITSGLCAYLIYASIPGKNIRDSVPEILPGAILLVAGIIWLFMGLWMTIQVLRIPLKIEISNSSLHIYRILQCTEIPWTEILTIEIVPIGDQYNIKCTTDRSSFIIRNYGYIGNTQGSLEFALMSALTRD